MRWPARLAANIRARLVRVAKGIAVQNRMHNAFTIAHVQLCSRGAKNNLLHPIIPFRYQGCVT